MNRKLVDNLLWLLGSIGLAFMVWIIATLQSDPVQERTFTRVSIQIQHEQGLLVTEKSSEVASVTVRAPRSIIDQLAPDDVTVWATLDQRPQGRYLIDLQPRIARQQALADTSPRQISITLEEAREQFVPVETQITAAPPRGFEITASPIYSVNQVLVSGPANQVTQAVAVRAQVNLQDQRATLTTDARLIPINAEGQAVTGVRLDPEVIRLTIAIGPRAGFREVRVRPNIQVETLPDGYALTAIRAEPDIVLISGSPDQLETLPATISTEPIDLSGRTSDFRQEVTVDLPNDDLFIVGNQTITVSVGVAPLLSSRQFDRVPVQIIGLGEQFGATLTPNAVTVLLTGAQITLESLEADDLRVLLDLTNLTEGTYQIAPEVTINQGQTIVSTISVLPAELDVIITAPTQTPTPNG